MSMVTDENGEGISYIKTDEYGNMRPESEKIWWDYLPTCLTELFLACGCQRPDAGRYATNNSRMAWSADERQRYWRVNQPGNGGGMVDAGAPMQRPMQVEDVDEARLHRQNVLQNNQQAGMQQNNAHGEPRRLFILKDPNGNNQQPTDHLREGETYLVEDVDETPRTRQVRESQVNNGDREYTRNPGNEETLRLPAGPHDAALLDEQIRQFKRAGGEPGGSEYQDEGGGVSSRYIDEQSIGVTPRDAEIYEDYTNNENNYVHGAVEQVESLSNRRALNDTVVPRLRIKSPNDDEMMEEIEDTLKTNRSRSKAHRTKRPHIPKPDYSDRDAQGYVNSNTPLGYGYTHTKSSILRYESNMAKLEVDQVREAVKDPLYQTLRKNSAVQADARRAAAYAAEDDSLETSRTLGQAALELKHKRDTVGYSHGEPEALERSGSVPNLQTTYETEAHQTTYSRRGSLDDVDGLEGNRTLNRNDKIRKSNKSLRRKNSYSDNIKHSNSNLPDDVKSTKTVASQGEEMTPDALKALEAEMKKDTEEGDQASKAATDRSRKKRNQMTEKKSIFTIAFDDMQTQQLPDSTPPDP